MKGSGSSLSPSSRGYVEFYSGPYKVLADLPNVDHRGGYWVVNSGVPRIMSNERCV